MDMSDVVCVNCGQNKHVSDAAFCQNCGIGLLNYCSDKNCISYDEELPCLPRDASFCPYCGEKTIYYDYLNNSEK